MPRALHVEELAQVAQQYANAALNARKAGIDGIELHCSSGYLINQFLDPTSNQRNDEYGGNPINRARFPTMVVQALCNAIGADRVGVRISPGNPYNGMLDEHPAASFAPFLHAIEALGCAYVHVLDVRAANLDVLPFVKRHFTGAVIANNMMTLEKGTELIRTDLAEAISFGRAFIANPDLVERLRAGMPLAKPDYSLLYTGEERGYIDYPTLSEGD